MTVTLRSGAWEAELRPAIGGVLSALRLDGVDVLRPMAGEATDSLQSSCFPLAPYCNRIRDGRFRFGGRVVVLPPNHLPEVHSLHGLSWQRPWAVEGATASACVLVDEYDGTGPWPWAYAARQRIELSSDGIAIAIALTNRANEPMPAGLGLHPYFRRRPETAIAFSAAHALVVDEQLLPTGAVAPSDRFTGPLPSQTTDLCFSGWHGSATISDEGGAITLSAEGSAHLHIYAPADGSVLCLEPVSHTPDALNRAPAEMIVLPPGCLASLRMRISAEMR
jgi:aldose 1-epimerase